MSINNFLNSLNTISDKTWDDFSEQTIERTKWIILDTIVAAWEGMSEKEVSQLVGEVGKTERSELHPIPIIGTDFFTSGFDSLTIHGTSIVSNEIDEGNQFAKGHPAAHIFAPAYLAAIENKATGKEFITAFILGYEVAARFAYACNMNDDMHPHGTWGTIGATVVAGLLQKKSKEEIISAVLLSATLPLATSWEAAVTGGTVRNLYTGISSQIAYQALTFQKSGFQSSSHIVEHLWGKLISTRLDPVVFEKDLWNPPLIDKSFFKYYPSCRFSHSAIDALYALLARGPIDVSEIKSVTVETYKLAARLNDPKPPNKLAAKFSIPYLLACILLNRNLFQCFSPSALSDETILELSEKILVVENDEMTQALPEERAAKVTVTLTDGKKYTEEVKDSSGSFKEPLSEQELTKKYLAVFKDDRFVESLINRALTLDQSSSFMNWVQDLRSKGEILA
ncbi:MmgE/PrpD family protein [Neobacillus drentensis]|uniref:MmgE/PrpD family protein n=1 Tax=Neobacillus drentensis TaxID=220684 RepID=UPI00300094AD